MSRKSVIAVFMRMNNSYFLFPIAKQNHANSKKKIAGIHIPVMKQTTIASNAKTAMQPHMVRRSEKDWALSHVVNCS